MNQRQELQGDLFSYDSPLMTGVKGERSIMAYPFFALAKGVWTKPLVYQTDTISIEVGPGPKGVATIYDKEILLYIASLMVDNIDAGRTVTQDFVFTALDLFRVTGVNRSANSYTRLVNALERLQGTQIKTNIEAGGEGEAGFFSWIESARLQYITLPNGEKRLKAVKVRLCDWLFRAVLHDRHILEYAPTYFELGPVERRLYEVARSACSDGPVTLTLEELRVQLGYQSPVRQLKAILRNIIQNGCIPGFSVSIGEPRDRKFRRDNKVAGDLVTLTPDPNSARRIKGHKRADESESDV